MRLLTRLLCLLLAGTPLWVSAQTENDSPEMATGLRSDGLIWVVVGVIVIIVGGLILYLTRIDRRLSRMEKETSTKS